MVSGSDCGSDTMSDSDSGDAMEEGCPPPLLGVETKDLLSALPLNYVSFQERFPQDGEGRTAFVSVRPMTLCGYRPRAPPRAIVASSSMTSFFGDDDGAGAAAPAAVYVRAWLRSGLAAFPYQDGYDESLDEGSARRVARTRPSTVTRVGGCVFDAQSLLLEAPPRSRLVVSLHDRGLGDAGAEAGNVVGVVELPAVDEGCLVDKFRLVDPKTGRPTGAAVACAVKRIRGFLPPAIYQHVLYVYEGRPAPFWGPLLHTGDEPWSPLGIGLGAPHPGVADDSELLPGGRIADLDTVWPRAAGPGAVLVSDWTICNPPYLGDDDGWTYGESLAAPDRAQYDFYGATVRCRRFYRHAADDDRVIEVTKDDLPPFVLYDHVVRVHRQLASDRGSAEAAMRRTPSWADVRSELRRDDGDAPGDAETALDLFGLVFGGEAPPPPAAVDARRLRTKPSITSDYLDEVLGPASPPPTRHTAAAAEDGAPVKVACLSNVDLADRVAPLCLL